MSKILENNLLYSREFYNVLYGPTDFPTGTALVHFTQEKIISHTLAQVSTKYISRFFITKDLEGELQKTRYPCEFFGNNSNFSINFTKEKNLVWRRRCGKYRFIPPELSLMPSRISCQNQGSTSGQCGVGGDADFFRWSGAGRLFRRGAAQTSWRNIMLMERQI